MNELGSPGTSTTRRRRAAPDGARRDLRQARQRRPTGPGGWNLFKNSTHADDVNGAALALADRSVDVGRLNPRNVFNIQIAALFHAYAHNPDLDPLTNQIIGAGRAIREMQRCGDIFKTADLQTVDEMVRSMAVQVGADGALRTSIGDHDAIPPDGGQRTDMQEIINDAELGHIGATHGLRRAVMRCAQDTATSRGLVLPDHVDQLVNVDFDRGEMASRLREQARLFEAHEFECEDAPLVFDGRQRDFNAAAMDGLARRFEDALADGATGGVALGRTLQDVEFVERYERLPRPGETPPLEPPPADPPGGEGGPPEPETSPPEPEPEPPDPDPDSPGYMDLY
jgi:hypothetical protein